MSPTHVRPAAADAPPAAFLVLDLDVARTGQGPLPLTFTLLLVRAGRVEAQMNHTLDWTRVLGPRLGGGRKGTAVATHGRRRLTPRDLRRGDDPRRVLPDIAAALAVAAAAGWPTALHTLEPALGALANALRRHPGVDLPDLVVTSTGLLEAAGRAGVTPRPDVPGADFLARADHAADEIPPLGECLEARRLDPGVPPGDPLWAAHGVRVLYQALIGELAAAQG